MAEPTVTFSGGTAAVAPLGVGAWSWGDSSTWGMGTYDQDLSEDTIAQAVDAYVVSVRSARTPPLASRKWV